MTAKRSVYTLTGIAYWAKLNTPNQWDKFSVDLALNSEKEIEKALEIGLNVQQDSRNTHGGFPFVALSMPETDNDGEKISSIPVFLEDGSTPKDFIGNGSEVTATFAAGPFTYGKKSGTYNRLQSVKVHKLVVFNKKAAS